MNLTIRVRSIHRRSGFIFPSVSQKEIRRFEWIFRQFKEETRRLSSAKSRVDDAEMAEKTPKLRIKEFLRHTLAAVYCKSIAFMNKVIPIFVD